MNEHPKVRVHLIDGNPVDHVAAVRNLELDATFVTGSSHCADCETEQLWFERIFVVLPNDHPVTKKANLRWSDIAGERFIVSDAPLGLEFHNHIVANLAELGRHPDIQLERLVGDNLLSLVALGCGLTLTNEAAVSARHPGLEYRQLTGEAVTFSVVWSARNDNPASRRLLSMARMMKKRRDA